MIKRFVIILIFPVIAGCSQKLHIAGSFQDFNEVFSGDMVHNTLEGGGGSVNITGRNTKFSCNGFAKPPHIIPNVFSCAGQKGLAEATCTDGRILKLDWTASSCNDGYANGTDQDMNRVNLFFSTDKTYINEKFSLFENETLSKPRLPPVGTSKNIQTENSNINSESSKRVFKESSPKVQDKNIWNDYEN